MNEKSSILDTLVSTICIGFCALGVVAIVGSLASEKERRDREPEYLMTSRGRKIYIASLRGATITEFPNEAPTRTAEPEPGVEEIRRPVERVPAE